MSLSQLLAAGVTLPAGQIVPLSRLLLLAASVGLFGVAVRARQTETGPVGRPFLALLGLLSATALCLAVTAGAGTANKLIWLGTNLVIPVALLAFSCRYYGIALFGSRPRVTGVVAPLVLGGAGSLLLILGTTTKVPAATPPIEVLAGLPAVAYEIAATLDRVGRYYTAAVVVVAVGIVAVNVIRYEHLDTRLAAAVAFVGGWPWLGNFVVPELGAAYGDAATISVLAGGYVTSLAVAGLVVGPLRLLDSSPAAGNIGPDRVLDSMSDAVVIADDGGQVLRVNVVACETFDTTAAESVGQPVSAVVGQSLSALTAETPISIETVEGARQFDVTCSPVTDSGANSRGTVLVMRDVTQRQNRQQRLSVLNRVLRHNLRNDATSIIGRAQLISDGDGGEDSAEEIIETTRDLVGVAESARDIESMMAATGSREPLDIEAVVERVVADVTATYPDVEVTTAVPALTATGSERVLETVLSELVENAAEHNDTAEPYIVISAEQSEDDSVTIAVADNGPGVPEHERAVLEAGDEDSLQHGSGLGLWAVHWGVTQLGGQLSITDNTPRGTVATVSVPVVEFEPVSDAEATVSSS